jgi:hypothetical protein
VYNKLPVQEAAFIHLRSSKVFHSSQRAVRHLDTIFDPRKAGLGVRRR